MIQTLPAYLEELKTPFLPLSIGSTDSGVRRAQEWLTLAGFATGIDGDFGPATKAAVEAFQAAKGTSRDDNKGIIDGPTWGALIAPLATATALSSMPDKFGERVCRVARQYLEAKAREVGGDNRGPWVRQFGRGLDQSTVGFFPWCQVFANDPWFRAARELGVALPFALTENGVQSAYVPWVVESARRAGKFRNGAQFRETIPPGSMFFVPGQIDGVMRHIHVGIVVSDDGTTIRTIEGNTNEAGGSNGYAVAQRYRKKSTNDYGLI